MKHHTIVLLMLLGLVCATITAHASSENTVPDFNGSSWAKKIKQRGVLRVGLDTFVPWAMKDKTGKFIGFEIEIAEALAKDMGVKAQFVPTAWNGIIPALLADKFDILIGGMTITTERSEKILFTDPYEYSGQAMAANRQVAPGLSKIEDFNKKEINIAVRMGTTAEITARSLFPKAAILPFGDEGQATQELRNGKAHAFVSSAPLPAQLAAKHPDSVYLPISGMLTKEPIGMGLAPKNKDALPGLNSWIKRQSDSGWLEKRWHYWFETVDWEKEIQ